MSEKKAEILFCLKTFFVCFLLSIGCFFLIGTRWITFLPSTLVLGLMIFWDLKKALGKENDREDLISGFYRNTLASFLGLGGIFAGQTLASLKISYPIELFFGTIFFWLFFTSLAFLYILEEIMGKTHFNQDVSWRDENVERGQDWRH